MMTTKAKVQTQHAVTNIIQFPAKRLVEREGRLRDRRIKECNPLQPIDKGRKTQIAALFIDDVEDAPHFHGATACWRWRLSWTGVVARRRAGRASM